MPEELIVKHCSPTLAGIKTGSIFSCIFKDDQDLKDSLSELNELLKDRGLRAIPLKYTRGGGHAIVYVYRPQMLDEDISEKKASEILRHFGYRTGSTAVCIAQLMKRLRGADSDSFPHEIGLFLGYPPEDVDGFIKHRAGGCKLCGCWKVYGDVESAKKKFESYRNCTENFYRRWRSDGSIRKLIAELG